MTHAGTSHTRFWYMTHEHHILGGWYNIIYQAAGIRLMLEHHIPRGQYTNYIPYQVDQQDGRLMLEVLGSRFATEGALGAQNAMRNRKCEW